MQQIVKYSGVIAVSLLLASGITGCGGLLERDKPQTDLEILQGQEGRTLWESKLQYVRIVDRDIAGIANEHPSPISAEEMRTVLSSLYVTERSGIIGKTENPVFSIGELQVLSTALANGFSQVQANEDINFVTIGAHKGTLGKEQKTTSGRVFISGGRLNIIFGLIHEIYRDKDPITQQPIDRRIHPLLPGTRKFDSKPPSRIALDKGQSNYLDSESGKERTDWLIIDIATVLKTAAERKGDNDGSVSPELLEDVARNKQETGNLRHDVSNVKEILFELSDEIELLKQQIEELKAKP